MKINNNEEFVQVQKYRHAHSIFYSSLKFFKEELHVAFQGYFLEIHLDKKERNGNSGVIIQSNEKRRTFLEKFLSFSKE